MPTVNPLLWRALRAPKKGNTDAEYEDAWAFNLRSGRFAIADGASEASYAELWARALVEGFVAARNPWELTEWLNGPRQRWAAEVDALELPWYAEIKREQGAFATFLGLAVKPPTPGQPNVWRALAVGDSCLVRYRDGQGPRAFPLTKSAEFSNQPQLLASRPSLSATPTVAVAGGTYLPGDRFYLMTDALAQWFLLSSEKNRRPWDQFERLLGKPKEYFPAWLEKRREQDELRNDDVTLLAIGPISEAGTPQEDASP